MRQDHRPYSVKRLHRAIERQYAEHFIRPQLDSLGDHFKIMRPWHLKLHGADIHFGHCVHVVAASHRKVALTTWRQGEHAGRIDIGDYALLCPGVRLDSAAHIDVGSNCMIASSAYLTDADWHDIYDRARPIGNVGPIVLEDNVWIGDSSIVCKGVRIGANSVVGAGSVVVHDIPPNVIAAGNPARVVKALDPDRELRRRQDLLADPQGLDLQMDGIDRLVHGHNRWPRWLRSLVWPRDSD